MEKLVTSPIERDLKEVDGIKKMMSTSAENRSYIMLQLDPDVATAAEIQADVEEVVDRFDIPDGAEEPDVEVWDTGLVPIIEVVLGGDLPPMVLREQARLLEESLELIPEVARVSYSGLRDLEIQVEANPERLSKYRISLNELVQALAGQNRSIPGGVLERPPEKEGELGKDLVIRTKGDFVTEEDVRKTVIRANPLGNPIYVEDVASVALHLEEAAVLNRTNGEPSIRLTVLKKENADAIRLVDRVRETVSETLPGLHEGLSVTYVNDFSQFIRRRLSVLTSNLLIGLTLVVLVLSVMLPWRVALVTTVGIPFSFLATIFVFYINGVSINLITMMGLIIVIGMLVDDAIVVTENSIRYMEEGMAPLAASTRGTQEIWPAVTASVLTTVLAFFPLMIMSGIFGKFIQFIPAGVILALIFSLLQSFFILPYHIGRWVHRPNENEKRGWHQRLIARTDAFWQRFVVAPYLRLISGLIRIRYLTILAFVVFLIGTGFVASRMKLILFPPDGIEMFLIRVDAPVGTRLEDTMKLLEPLEEMVASLPDHELEAFVTTGGIQQQSVDDPNTRRGTNYGQIMVYLTPEEDRDRDVDNVIETLRSEIGENDRLKIVFERISGGPPVGKPISVGIRGREYSEILRAVEDMKKFVSGLEGTSDIDDTYAPGKQEVIVRVFPAEAAAAQLSVASIGYTVRAAYEGLIATTITRLDEEVDVRVSLRQEDKTSLDSLRSLFIPNPVGNLIPLNRVADFELTEGVEALEHENNQRQVRVTGEVDTNVTSASEVSAKIQAYVPEFLKAHPNVRVFFGGEDFDTQESLNSLARAFVMAILLIYFLLILTFKSFIQPFLVLTAIPLGLAGVIWTFFIHGEPFSFMCLLGAVALGGVVVNNSIVYLDFVNRERRAGVGLDESVLRAGSMRIRPIFLTTLTTVFGLLPTAYGIGGLDQFVVPVALSLGWGVLIGAMLTVITIPVTIRILDDISGLLGRFRSS